MLLRCAALLALAAACDGGGPANAPPDEPDRATPDPEELAASGPALQVLATANRAGPELLVEPAELRFGFVLAGSDPVLEVRLRNEGNPVHVAAVELASSSSPAYELVSPFEPLDLGTDEEAVVGVRYLTTAASSDPDLGELRVEDDDGTHRVKLSGFASCPCLRIEPGTIEFGKVPAGYEDIKSVSLINCGIELVTVGSVDATPPELAEALGPVATPMPVPAGGLLKLTFNGDVIPPGDFSIYLTLDVGTAACGAQRTVHLTGTR